MRHLDKVFYDQWQSSPFADEYLARMGAAVNEALTAGGKGAKHAAQETGQNRASSPSDRTGKRAGAESARDELLEPRQGRTRLRAPQS